MINISRRFPWMLWPDSICPSFSKDPILQKEQGDKYWNDRVETNYDIPPGKIFNITYEHFPKDKLLISIYNNKEFEFNLKDKPLAVADNPVIFLGVNTHITQKESEDIDIIVHNFKIYDTNGIACHHNFKNIIHGKSVDITGNLNFLYQIA